MFCKCAVFIIVYLKGTGKGGFRLSSFVLSPDALHLRKSLDDTNVKQCKGNLIPCVVLYGDGLCNGAVITVGL